MAERIIIWSENAKFELKEIFEYFNFRNKSKIYSLKLNKTIQSELNLLIQNPEIGIKTEVINVRGLMLKIIMFYQINEIHLVILSVRDTRQYPENLKYN